MDAKNAGLIVPKVSFLVSTLALKSGNIKKFLFWALLTFLCCNVVNLYFITLIADGVFDKIWLIFWTFTLLFQTGKNKITFTLDLFTLK